MSVEQEIETLRRASRHLTNLGDVAAIEQRIAVLSATPPLNIVRVFGEENHG